MFLSVAHTLAITLAVGIALTAFFLFRSAKKQGKLEQENETLQKTKTILENENNIAARPSDSPDNVIRWLSGGKRK